jgi:hypothetical protein
MQFDLNSYRTSYIFSYITEDYKIIKVLFDKYIKAELKKIKKFDQELENQRMSLTGDFTEGDAFSIYLDQVRNSRLQDYFLNASLLFYYSQFEIKLLEICERFTILVESPKIDQFIKDNELISIPTLDKIAKYLLANAKIDIKKLNNWLKIRDFNDVRNAIAHNEKVEDNKINTFKSIASRNKKGIIFYEESKILKINKEYLDFVIKDSFDFVEKVIIEIWDKHCVANLKK